MKFTIVTPSYNCGRYIACAANSVLSQTGVNLEYRVYDACSTDETAEVLRSLAPHPALSVTIERDSGQTSAINKGFAGATGDWVGWLNADDAYLPGALEAARLFIERNATCDVVYGDTLFWDERNMRARVKTEHSFDAQVLKYYGCFIGSTSTFVRREVITAAGPLDESLRVVMDYEYYLRLAAMGCRFGYIPRPIGMFRVHGANISSVEADRRRRERHAVQLRYCGLTMLPDTLRIRAFDVLEKVFTARRAIVRARERLATALRGAPADRRSAAGHRS